MRKFRDVKNKKAKTTKKPDFTKQLVSQNIYVLNYSSHRKLCNAVMRFLSPIDIFPGLETPLTVPQFKSQYKKKYGSFSFRSDWEGFVIPKSSLKPFLDGKWNPLTKSEKLFLREFKNHKPGNFAVIGISAESSPTTLKHEMAHALYEVNLNYRNDALKVLESVNLVPVFKILKRNGYESSLFHDEAHAYIMNNLSWLKSEGLTHISSYYESCAKLNYLFEKYI